MFCFVFQKKPSSDLDEPYDTIPLHHGYAVIAQDYTKRKHVFRFIAVDQSVQLFRVSSEQEMVEWVLVLNHTAAFFSAPVAVPVGSHTIGPSRFQTAIKPMYPSKKSGLTPVSMTGND